MVCRLSISLVSEPMNCPTSSTKKFRRKVGSDCLSSQALTSSAKSSIETEYEALYCWMTPLWVLPSTSVKARSMLGPSSAVCSRPWTQGMPAMRSIAFWKA